MPIGASIAGRMRHPGARCLLGMAPSADPPLLPCASALAWPPPPRVRLLLEHSAALAVEGGQEPLQRRLAGLPPPVAACLSAALAELPDEAPDIK